MIDEVETFSREEREALQERLKEVSRREREDELLTLSNEAGREVAEGRARYFTNPADFMRALEE